VADVRRRIAARRCAHHRWHWSRVLDRHGWGGTTGLVVGAPDTGAGRGPVWIDGGETWCAGGAVTGSEGRRWHRNGSSRRRPYERRRPGYTRVPESTGLETVSTAIAGDGGAGDRSNSGESVACEAEGTGSTGPNAPGIDGDGVLVAG